MCNDCHENKPIVAYCSYCKEAIYVGEAFVIRGEDYYHAEKTEEHDNCFKINTENFEEEE